MPRPMIPRAQLSPTNDRWSVAREVLHEVSHWMMLAPPAVAPAGMFICGVFRVIPDGAELDASATSVGMVILVLKSPIRNSPNATVFDVPSRTSRTPIGLPIYWKQPFGGPFVSPPW